MKIVFFIAGIFFFSIAYSQQKTFFNPDPNIQRYIKKKNEERLMQTALNSEPPVPAYVIVCFTQHGKPFSLFRHVGAQKNYWKSFFSSFSGDWWRAVEIYTPARWKNDTKFKKYQGFLFYHSKTDFRPHFN